MRDYRNCFTLQAKPGSKADTARKRIIKEGWYAAFKAWKQRNSI